MARITTIGVYIFENLVINFSVFVLFSSLFSIISIILLAVLVSNVLVAFISKTLSKLIVPLKTVSFKLTFRGTDSPVKLLYQYDLCH